MSPWTAARGWKAAISAQVVTGVAARSARHGRLVTSTVPRSLEWTGADSAHPLPCLQLYDLITATQMKTLCKAALPLLLMEPNMLELEAPIKIVGDIHGQFFDLLRILDAEGA